MDNERDVPITMLKYLKYMNCAIKDILRLHPSVPAIGRMAKQDIELSMIDLTT